MEVQFIVNNIAAFQMTQTFLYNNFISNDK